VVIAFSIRSLVLGTIRATFSLLQIKKGRFFRPFGQFVAAPPHEALSARLMVYLSLGVDDGRVGAFARITRQRLMRAQLFAHDVEIARRFDAQPDVIWTDPHNRHRHVVPDANSLACLSR
jgi:hypothetical protein